MNVTEVLRNEHQLIQDYLAVLNKICFKLIDKHSNVDWADLKLIVKFFEEFADNFHNQKENVLFDNLIGNVDKNVETEILKMTSQHKISTGYIKILRKTLSNYETKNFADLFEFRINALDYISMMQTHIEMENQLLFNTIDDLFDEKKTEEMFEKFVALEETFPDTIFESYTSELKILKSKYQVN